MTVGMIVVVPLMLTVRVCIMVVVTIMFIRGMLMAVLAMFVSMCVFVLGMRGAFIMPRMVRGVFGMSVTIEFRMVGIVRVVCVSVIGRVVRAIFVMGHASCFPSSQQFADFEDADSLIWLAGQGQRGLIRSQQFW